MRWEWELLLAVIRLLFLLAPFMNVAKDFALTGDDLDEAQELSVAGSCRAMLVSFPVELLLIIMAEADAKGNECRDKRLFVIAVYGVVCIMMAYGLFRISTGWFRGKFLPLAWFVVFSALTIVAKYYILALAVARVCHQ